MTKRTSETDPIRVDWLPADLAGMPGRLGMTIAPGKSASSQFGSRWARDLGKDLKRLREHESTDCLVTLVERDELRRLGIEELFDTAGEYGIDVYWLPYPDGGVPDRKEAVAALVDHLLCRVCNGERVVVHCRGGLGRSGTVVGCCLRSLEYEPEVAIEVVRDARPGAIENARHGRQHLPVPRCTPTEVPSPPKRCSPLDAESVRIGSCPVRPSTLRVDG